MLRCMVLAFVLFIGGQRVPRGLELLKSCVLLDNHSAHHLLGIYFVFNSQKEKRIFGCLDKLQGLMPVNAFIILRFKVKWAAAWKKRRVGAEVLNY